MPLYKFGAGDVFYNRIKTYPSSSFYIYSGSVYYNNRSTEAGANVANVGGVPVGHVSLYGYNVDRAANADTSAVVGVSGSDAANNVSDTGYIYPYVVKGLSKTAFKDMTREDYVHNFVDENILTGSYMMSASISRKMYESAAGFNDTNVDGAALKNSLDFAKRLGEHYDFASGSSAAETTAIDIPSVFYGSEIKKGTVNLKFYVTGTLVAQARDKLYNGALIQESGAANGYASSNDGATVGVVLYKEGLIILTSSVNIEDNPVNVNHYTTRDNSTVTALAFNDSAWIHYGLGLPTPSRTIIRDGVTVISGVSQEYQTTQAFLQSASFGLEFAGTHKVPTVTMLAHANRGELNYTSNPTYIVHGEGTGSYHPITSSYYYKEVAKPIKNVHSASYSDPSGSLKKTTYITKVGIYDDKKKLIGIASVAKPVKKTEERDLTFKLKLDI
jgi:hypothetical protein